MQFLLSHVHDLYGILDQALVWIRSCLSDRLRVNTETLSDKQEVNFGVPQGSILKSILYCLYTKPVSDTIHRFGLLHYLYAGDTYNSILPLKSKTVLMTNFMI